jgi:sigma-B regulation protein RsbU (phosphoserine phosphatase)
MPKLKITTKILLALSGLSLVSLILFGYIALSKMIQLGEFALGNNLSLGEGAVKDSEEALMKQAETHLLKLAEDQAALANALLEKVGKEINVMTNFASHIWKRPSAKGWYRHSYSQEEKPDDIYAASFYFLTSGTKLDAVEDELNLSSNIDDIFIPVYANDSNLDSIYIGTESGIFRLYPWMLGLEPSYNHKKRDWYIKAVKEGKTVWSQPYINAIDKELIVTCSKPFYLPGGELVGVVGTDVTLKVMNERILSTQIGESGYAFLIDDKGNIITHPGMSPGNTRWDERYLTQNLLQSSNEGLKEIVKDMIAGKVGIHRFEGDPTMSGGEDKYTAYAPIISTNWSLGVAMPVKEIIAPAKATKNKITLATNDASKHIDKRIRSLLAMLVGTFAAIFFIIAVIACALSKKITKPILALNQGAKIVGGGNLDYKLDIKTGDEIEDLAKAFDKMTSDLKIYIKNLKETTAAKERIESELKIANEIQASMLPRIFPPFPDRKEFEIFATMDPAKEVGGDFYDFFFVDKNRLCFLIGDVSGKGVPAALFMAITKTLLKTEALRGLSPDEILIRVNKILYPDNEACMFITVFCVILNIETGRLHFSNAGHNPPLILATEKGFEFIEVPKGFVLGPMENVKFERGELILKPDDIIFLYTDGVTEAMNPQDKLFSPERLKACLSNLKERDIKDIVNGIRREIQIFSEGTLQSDDITMLALRYKGKGV